MDEKNTGPSRAKKRERWEGILAEHEQSGLSAAAFCRERGLSYQTFRYWKKRLRAPAESRFPAARFHEVRLAADHSGDCLEIVLGSVVVRVPPGFDGADLRRVLALLAVSPC